MLALSLSGYDPNGSSRCAASMRLGSRPRHEPFGLESSNNGGARTYSLAISKHRAIGRQIEVYPACPVRHDEEMRIRDRIVAPHQVLVRRKMPIKMGEPGPETNAKYISAFLWHAFIEERREATLMH